MPLPVIAATLLVGCARQPVPTGPEVALDEALLASTPLDSDPADAGEPIARMPYEYGGLTPTRQLHGFSQYEGQPVLVNLWASWCSPCQRELPQLAMLHERFGEYVHFVGVAVNDTPPAVLESFEKAGVRYPTVLDNAGRVSATFRNDVLPSTFLFDANGDRLWFKDGLVDAGDAELQALLQGLEPR